MMKKCRFVESEGNPEGSDELVAELDLILSQPSLGEEIFLLNYPQRVPGASIGVDRAIERVRVRPQHRRVEVTVSLLPKPQDDNAAYSEKSFDFSDDHLAERPMGDRQKFISAQPGDHECNIATGLYVRPSRPCDGNGSFTIVPIRRFARMCPSFDHIDEMEAEIQLERAFAKAARDKERGTLDSNVIEEQMNTDSATNDVQVEMTFTKRETDRSAERRKNSFPYLQRIESEDQWVAFDFIDEYSLTAVEKREQLFMKCRSDISDPTEVKQEDHEQNRYTTSSPSPHSYIDMWYAYAPAGNPVHDMAKQVGELKSGHGSMRTLRRMRPEGAVQVVVTHARVVKFEAFRSCVSNEISTEKLVAMIRNVSFLLRGCWVSNKPRRSSRQFSSQKQPPRLAASRILVLDMFRRSRVVVVSDVLAQAFTDMTPPSVEHIEAFLSEVADNQSGTGWLFRLDDDDDFVSQYREVAQDEDLEWEKRLNDAQRVMLLGAGTGRSRTKALSRSK